MKGREANSYGQVCTTYKRAEAGSLDGRMVYYKFGDDDGIQFAFALPFENPLIGTSVVQFNTHQPSKRLADKENLVANWVQVSNVSAQRLKGTLYFHDMNGSILGTQRVNLRDGARYDYSAHAYGASRAGIARFHPDDNKVEYQMRAVRYLYDNIGSHDSFTTAYPFRATVGSGELLIAPVDTRGGMTCYLEIANTLQQRTNVTLKFYNSSGKQLLDEHKVSLKAYASVHVAAPEQLTGQIGSVVVTGDRVGSIVGGVVHYDSNAEGGVSSMYVAELQEGMGKVSHGSYNTYLQQGCDLLIANASATKTEARLSMTSNTGKEVLNDHKVVVPAWGVANENICSLGERDSYGIVKLTTNANARLACVLVRAGSGGRYRIASVLR